VEECFTKGDEKRKEKKANKARAEKGSDGGDGDKVYNVATVKIKKAGTDIHELEGYYLYDTGASHHTTNQLQRLQNIPEVNIPVRAHDKA